jgi:hypothetical protein
MVPQRPARRRETIEEAIMATKAKKENPVLTPEEMARK